MSVLHIHGYQDPDLPQFSLNTVSALNLHAVRDLAKRSKPGGVITLLAMFFSALGSDIIHQYPLLIASLLCLMSLVTLLRALVFRLATRSSQHLTRYRSWVFISFAGSAILWGVYVSANLSLYQLTPSNMVIMMFTIGITAGATTSLFIWERLAQLYLLMVYIPIIVVSLFFWDGNISLMFFGLGAYLIFLLVQSSRTNKEYWRALCVNQLLTEQTRELAIARDSAEQSSNAKSEFLSSMSHELRTPLNAILGFSQLMATDTQAPPSPMQKESISYIQTASNHLLSLINQILDLAKIESGKLELRPDNVAIHEVVTECLPLIQKMADEKNIHLSVADDPKLAVIADPIRLKQVLLNLLSNGIKYNRPKGKLTLEYEQQAHRLKVKIRDTGLGIAEHHRDAIFKSFSRLGQENSSIEGSGVGLVITKTLIESMQGQLDYESQEGQGSTFWFELPLVSPAVCSAP